MPLPFAFASSNSPDLTWLDANFTTLGYNVTITCTMAGTNALVLTPISTTPTVASYVDYQLFVGVYIAAANTGATTAQVSGLSAMNVYKQGSAGPIPLAGGELIFANMVLLVYDFEP